MIRKLIFMVLLLPVYCLAQVNISGRVINAKNNKPVVNASVFLGNSSVGDKTTDDGSFSIANARPGNYELVVSIVGFDTYRQNITVADENLRLPDIAISGRTILLDEVTVRSKTDPNRERNLKWFEDEFLGRSALASDCKIMNPELIDLDYDDAKDLLTASSIDFIYIDNKALGYHIKYLLTNFTRQINGYDKKVHFEGVALFESMHGTAEQERRWQQARKEVYDGSEMHFLRSMLTKRMDEEGFRVLRVFQNAHGKQNLVHLAMSQDEIMKPTPQKGTYALGCDGDGLVVTYNKDHHFYKNGQFAHLNDPSNNENTVLKFNLPYALFDANGCVNNPNSLSFSGAWGHNRIAELLPQDYEDRGANLPGAAGVADSTLSNKLKHYAEQHTVEKAYLHFDKPYYASGDTIYFKAYVTLGEEHVLSDLSGVFYVDLINAKNKIDQSLKLHLVNGVAWGDFALPDSLPKGNYRIRAYTNWMRNDSDDVFFDQSIPIGSIREAKIYESTGKSAQVENRDPDIQFFPEGGELINGIASKIAFRAVAPGGKGVDVKGIITDNENREVISIQSSHLGMGYFNITPQHGKTYKANLTFANGTRTSADLPKAIDNGIVLTIDNDSIPNATVKIMANDSFYQENKGKTFSLLIYSGGIATTVSCKLDSPVIKLDILKRRLHTGVATVTLFSAAHEPLSERLLFIQNFNQDNLIISSNKPTYRQREMTSIKLNVLDRAAKPAAGHFSVAVIDESKVPVDENTENTILTNLLLTSDLRGTVEQPNYYFNNITQKTLTDLDLVMLTHGYRRFKWEQVLQNSDQPLAYQPEKGLEITGIAKNLSGKPLANAKVSLITGRDGTFITRQTDSEGHFIFENVLFTDTGKFILQAINAKGQNSTQLEYNKVSRVPVVSLKTPIYNDTAKTLMTPYLENNKKVQDDLAKYGNIHGKMLKEVHIKAAPKRKENDYPSSSLMGPGFADQVIHRDFFEQHAGYQLSDILFGRLKRNVNFYKDGFYGTSGGPLLVLLDGAEFKNINDISPHDIETFELFFGANAAIYGVRAGNGVIVITTHKGGGVQAKDISSTGILPITAVGFYKVREFYSPKYDAPISTINRADLRSTIYWNPELVTDADGNASFNYYNADGHGTYRMVIEGIDENGNLGRQVYRYKVQ